MKTPILKIAVVMAALALGACASETKDNSNDKLSSLFGDQDHSMTPDGDVNCDEIHAVLLANGIDPELLEPEVVREACVDGGQADSMCDIVAYSCFGPQDDCNDPPEPVDACQQLWDVFPYGDLTDPATDPDDPSQHSLEEILTMCDAGQLPEDICELARECAYGNPPPQPGPDVCEEIAPYIDPDGQYDPDEVFQICLQLGYDDATCSDAMGCFPWDPTDPTDPNVTEEQCHELRSLVESGQTSEDEIYETCVNIGYSEASCQEATYVCFAQPPVDPPQPGDDCQVAIEELRDRGYEFSPDSMASYEECAQITQSPDLCEYVLNQCI